MASPEYHSEDECGIVGEIKMVENMKFFHSKNEGANGGRPTHNPNSAAQNIKNCISVRIHDPPSQREDDEEALIQPDAKVGKRRVSETVVGIAPGICAFLIKENKELKQRQREQKMLEASRVRLEKANKKAGDQRGHPKSISRTTIADKTGNVPLQQVSPAMEEKTIPSLRRIKSVGDLKGTNNEANEKAKDRGEEYMNRLRAQRQAIKDGNLEKVIPPSSPQKARLTPNRQKTVVKVTHSRSSSASSKLSSYLGTSADLLDATRRDLTSNLRKNMQKAEKVLSGKFDSLGRYSSGHGNNWDDDSDSDESFYCIGERRFSTIDKARRVSGIGTDPWTDGVQEECRVCRKPSPGGVRGLCVECDKEFRRPAAAFLDENGEEVKPPPPLKIKKTLGNSEKAQVEPRDIHVSLADTEVKINQALKKPHIITPRDQRVDIDDGLNTRESESEYVSIYERWQTPELRALYRSPEYESTRWSPRLLDDDKFSSVRRPLRSGSIRSQDSPEGDWDTVPLVAKDGKRKKKSRSIIGKIRHESYYAYWEEVLGEDEESINSLKKRYDRYQKL